MKYIPVTGCDVCEYHLFVISPFLSGVDNYKCNNEDCDHELDITIHFHNKTIHPGCPLDDLKEVLKPIRDAMQAWDDYSCGKIEYLDSSTPWKALVEVLDLAKKAGWIDE